MASACDVFFISGAYDWKAHVIFMTCQRFLRRSFRQNSTSGCQVTYSNKKPERSTKRCPWWSTERPNDPLGDRWSAAASLKRWWRSMASKNGAFLRCQDSDEKKLRHLWVVPDCCEALNFMKAFWSSFLNHGDKQIMKHQHEQN